MKFSKDPIEIGQGISLLIAAGLLLNPIGSHMFNMSASSLIIVTNAIIELWI